MDYLEMVFRKIVDSIINFGPDVLGSLVILFIGWGAANWFGNKAYRVADRSQKVDSTLLPLISKTIKILVWIITIMAVLNQFGIHTGSILAILGAAGLAVGLALQGTLSNIAAGIMILLLRPFEVEDAVDIDGTVGIVNEIGIFVTKLNTFDNVAVTLPNAKVWVGTIKNFTRNDLRRLDLSIGISYGDEIDEATSIINEVLDEEERILDEPEPLIAVGELGDSSVNIYVRPWTQTEDLWPTRYDLRKEIKQRLEEGGITIPFPQRDVHIQKEE